MADDFASQIPDLSNFSDEDLQAIANGGADSSSPSPDDASQAAANPYLGAQINQESGGQDYDKSGNVLTSPKGAKGKMQVLDSTDTDPGYGVTPAKDDSLEERARVGRDYSAALQGHYGDPALGLAAYNWGPGNLDKWLANGANPAHMPKETKDYVKNIIGGTGKQYASADTGTQTDAMTDDTAPASDFSHMSDEDLQAIVDGRGADSSPDLSHLSDEQLMTIVNEQSLPGLGGAENMQPSAVAPPVTAAAGPQVPVYGADGVTPIQQQPPQPSPTDGLMLAGPTPQPDFAERSAADWAARLQKTHDIGVAADQGQQPLSSTLWQYGTNSLGALIGDPAMNALGSAGRYFHTGDVGDDNNPDNTTLTDIVKGAPGAVLDAVSPYLNPGLKDARISVADYVKSNPELSRNLAGANDLAMALPFMKPVGALAGAADTGITSAIDNLAPLADRDVASRNFLSNEGGARRGAGPTTTIPSAADMRADSSAIYKSLPGGAEALPAEGVDKFVDNITALSPQTRAGKIVAGDSALTKIVDRIAGNADPETGERSGGLKGQPMSLAEAQEVDEALGDHIDDLTDPTTGRLSKQGKKVQDIQTAFRKAINENQTEGSDMLNLARAKWAQAARMNDVERINARAELMQNPVTARQTGYRNLYLRLKQNPSGYSPQEIALVKRAADSGVVTNLLRVMGSRLGPIGAGVTGTAVGGPLGGALAFGTESAVAGTARNLANRIHLKRDTAVKQAIAGRPMPVVRPQTATAEAAPAVAETPKQITFQPDIIAGQGAGAVARPATGAEMANTEAARRLRVELGIDPDPQAAVRNGAASNTASVAPSALDKLGNLPISPNDTLRVGTQDLDAGSNTTISPEPSGSSNTAKNSPYSLRGPTENLTDINKTPPNTIYHDIANKATLIDKAEKAEKPAINMLKQATSDVPGVKVLGGRIKDSDTLNQKLEKKGRQPNEISDYLGARLQVDNAKAASHAIGNIARKANITHVDDFMNDEGRPGTGYRAIHIQIKNPDGFSYETQFVPKELMDVYDQERAIHDKWKDYRGNIPPELRTQHATDTDAAKKIFDDAWEKYKARTGEGGSSGGSQSEAYQPEVKTPISEGKPIKIHAEGKPDTAITPAGKEFNVRHAVVSGDDLIASNLDNMRPNPKYPQILQPRDRTSLASRQQITKYANDLNPRLLMNNPLSSEGSPIISKDGVVESGNGRTLSIKRAMSNNTEGAAKYKQALKDAGYNIRGVKNPILVRVREAPMTDAERIKLSQDSNADTKLGMSTVEQAKQDAGNLSSATLDKYRGGDIKLGQNREFVKSALKDMMPDNGLASVLSKDGALSQEVEHRINSALLHKAYGSEDITRLLAENTDNELTSLGKALTSSAPAWAKMRDAAANGLIPKNMDITQAITKAVKLIQQARHEGKPLSDYFRMDDMFKGKVDQRTGMIIRSFHTSDALTRFKSADKITKLLTDYTRKAGGIEPGVNLFGEKPMSPDDVLGSVFKDGDNDDETSGA